MVSPQQPWCFMAICLPAHLGPRFLPSDDQVRLAFRDADAGDEARIKGQVIGLDPIAEDHAIIGHLRSDHQLLAGLDLAEDDAGLRCLGDERLAYTVEQPVRVPAERKLLRAGGITLPVAEVARRLPG